MGPRPWAYALPSVLRVLIILPLNVCYKWSPMPWELELSLPARRFPASQLPSLLAGALDPIRATHTLTSPATADTSCPQWEPECRGSQGGSRMSRGISG